MTGRRPRAKINSSSAHVFTVLRFVAGLDEALGVTEISRQLALPPSTVHRALVTLEEAGYIQRFRNVPRFELGTMPHLLNRALVTLFALHSASREALQRLASETGETVAIWARLGWYAVRIAGAYGSHDIYHRARLGEARALHDGVGGLAILAALGADERAAYQAFARIDCTDAMSACRGGAAAADLALAPGFQALAVPLRDAGGEAIAALGIEGPLIATGEAVPAAVEATRSLLEALIASDPERFRSPFAHIRADDIRLDLPPPDPAQL